MTSLRRSHLIFAAIGDDLHPPYDLRQEPRSSFGLINPYFDQAGGGDIFVLAANLVSRAQESRQAPAVFEQLGEHVVRADNVFVIVRQPLMPGYIAD